MKWNVINKFLFDCSQKNVAAITNNKKAQNAYNNIKREYLIE